MSSCISEILSLLLSRAKLDRDRGRERLEDILKREERMPVEVKEAMRVMTAENMDRSAKEEEDGWERRLGCLLLCQTVLTSSLPSNCDLGLPPDLPLCCLTLLSDREARVRSASGQVLGHLCSRRGPDVYEAVRDSIFEAVKVRINSQSQVS